MKKKIVLASVVGNALEFFDFTLYGVFAGVIAALYFPSSDPTTSLLMSLGAFGVGFLMRPFGAMVFGYIGDHFGRKKALSFSVLMMGLPTLIIGLLPGYEVLGIGASLIVVLCRLLQGLCTGGEYNGAAIFSLEHMNARPGLIGGLITASCVIGAFTATFLGKITQMDDMPSWAWRLPFFFGAFISVAGFYIRRNLPETPLFQEALRKKEASLKKSEGRDQSKSMDARKSLWSQWARTISLYWKPSLITFSFGGFNGALSYTLFGFLSLYLSRYCGLSLSEAMGMNLYGLLAFMIGSPLMGMALDVSRGRVFFQRISLGILLLSVPIFLCLLSKIWALMILGQICLGLCTAAIAGTGHGAMQNLFPVATRYRGISFFFSLGMGIFGGGVPILYIYVIEQASWGLLFPAGILMALSLTFLGVVGFLFPKDNSKSSSHQASGAGSLPYSRTGTGG